MTTTTNTPTSPVPLVRAAEAVRQWVVAARAGRVQIAGLTLMTTHRTRASERNAFELGCDYERGQSRASDRRLRSRRI